MSNIVETADVSNKGTLVNDVQPENMLLVVVIADVSPAAITDTRLSLSLKAFSNAFAKLVPLFVQSHTLWNLAFSFFHVPLLPTPDTVGS